MIAQSDISKVEVANRGTMYRLTTVRQADQPTLVLAETGWGSGYGEWMTLYDESVAWSYVREKMPELAKRDGDREGWVKAFAEADIEIFGWEYGLEEDD